MSKEVKLNLGGVTNWYDHFVASDIELISAYIEQCEISNGAAIKDYHNLKTVDIEVIDDFQANITTSFRAVDGGLFNAQDIYENYFPMLNRHSTLVIVMSMFEKRLTQLCDWANTHYQLNKPFKRYNRSLLQSIKTYLVETVGLKFNESLNNNWDLLLALQSIRNNIIHNFGTYKSNNKYIDSYINLNKNLGLNDDNEFIFNHEFLKDLVPSFNELCRELQESIRSTKRHK